MSIDLVEVVIWRDFFFNDTATTEIYTLSLHDALPIPHAPLELHPISAFQLLSPWISCCNTGHGTPYCVAACWPIACNSAIIWADAGAAATKTRTKMSLARPRIYRDMQA